MIGIFSEGNRGGGTCTLHLVTITRLTRGGGGVDNLEVAGRRRRVMVGSIILPVSASSIAGGLRAAFCPRPNPMSVGVSVLNTVRNKSCLTIGRIAIVSEKDSSKLRRKDECLLGRGKHRIGNRGNRCCCSSGGVRGRKFRLPGVRIKRLVIVEPCGRFDLTLVAENREPVGGAALIRSPGGKVSRRWL